MCSCGKGKGEFDELHLFWVEVKGKYILVCEKCRKSLDNRK